MNLQLNKKTTKAQRFRLRHLEAERERQRQYARSKKGLIIKTPKKKKINNSIYRSSYYRNVLMTNPEYIIKQKAWNRVGYALKSGKLIKSEFCCGCLIVCNVQAHHENYNKPLDVVWVCRKCHLILENIKREIKKARQP